MLKNGREELERSCQVELWPSVLKRGGSPGAQPSLAFLPWTLAPGAWGHQAFILRMYSSQRREDGSQLLSPKACRSNCGCMECYVG